MKKNKYIYNKNILSWALPLFIILFYLSGLGSSPFKGWEELYWLTLGLFPEKISSPFSVFFPSFLKNLAPYPFEESPFFFRLGSVIPSLMTVGFLYFWGKSLFGGKRGVAAAFILSTSLAYFYGSRLFGTHGLEGLFLFLGLGGALQAWISSEKGNPYGWLWLSFYPLAGAGLGFLGSREGIWALMSVPFAWSLVGAGCSPRIQAFLKGEKKKKEKKKGSLDSLLKFSLFCGALTLGSAFFMFMWEGQGGHFKFSFFQGDGTHVALDLVLKKGLSTFLCLLLAFMPWSMFLLFSFKEEEEASSSSKALSFPLKKMLGVWGGVVGFLSFLSPADMYHPLLTPFLFALPPLALCVGDLVGRMWEAGGKASGKMRLSYGFYFILITLFSMGTFSQLLFHPGLLDLWYPVLLLVIFVNAVGLMVVYSGFFHKARLSLLLLVVGHLVFLSLVDYMSPFLYRSSGQILAEAILENLKPQDQVIVHGEAIPDLPIRLERSIGGYEMSPGFPGYVPFKKEELTRLWKGNHVLYVITSEEDLTAFLQEIPNLEPYYLKKEGHLILLSNQVLSLKEDKSVSKSLPMAEAIPQPVASPSSSPNPLRLPRPALRSLRGKSKILKKRKGPNPLVVGYMRNSQLLSRKNRRFYEPAPYVMKD
jgi:hypothetical protein